MIMNNNLINNAKIIGIDFSKPITINFGEYPCPVEPSIHCPHSKYSYEDMTIILSCNKECNIKNKKMEV